MNKNLTVSLKPADKGVFDVVVDGKLVFSKQKEGHFPTVDEIKKYVEPALTMPLEVASK